MLKFRVDANIFVIIDIIFAEVMDLYILHYFTIFYKYTVYSSHTKCRSTVIETKHPPLSEQLVA